MSDTFHEPVSQCPGCGADLRWKVGSSRVIVCEYCRYTSVRTDKGIEGLGKVADPVPTGARLAIGVAGSLDGVPFRLAGRLQLQWSQGAWDEWYAAFDDGRWGWISEAQGRYYAVFRVAPRKLPPPGALKAGRELTLSGLGRYVVTDVREAKYSAAKGELPEAFPVDGSPVTLVDLSGRNGAFATVDLSDPAEPIVFAGREVTLEELAISADGVVVPPAPARVSAKAATCAKCGAPLDLKAPDVTVRVACAHCGALNEANDGALRVVAELGKQQRRHKFKLGQDVTFGDTKYVFIGWLERACHVDGERYTWEEYLLYNPRNAGFRYLVCSDGHWSFVTPIAAGDVEHGAGRVTWKGRSFKRFASVKAKVSAVVGEFSWAVEVGETARVTDYVAPPEGLSEEASGGEIVWSHARYVTPADVWKAFGAQGIARPANGVGMIQPNPHAQAASTMTGVFALGLVALVALFLVFNARTRAQIVLDQQFELQPNQGVEAAPDAPPEQYALAVAFSEPFAISTPGRNLRARLWSNVNDAWVFASCALVNEDTSEVTEFQLESSYYSGTDSDGRWVEDDRVQTTYLGAMPAGKYVLRVEAQWDKGKLPPQISIELRSGVVRALHLVLALLAILVPLGWVLVRRAGFEQSRWEQAGEGD